MDVVQKMVVVKKMVVVMDVEKINFVIYFIHLQYVVNFMEIIIMLKINMIFGYIKDNGAKFNVVYL